MRGDYCSEFVSAVANLIIRNVTFAHSLTIKHGQNTSLLPTTTLLVNDDVLIHRPRPTIAALAERAKRAGGTTGEVADGSAELQLDSRTTVFPFPAADAEDGRGDLAWIVSRGWRC